MFLPFLRSSPRTPQLQRIPRALHRRRRAAAAPPSPALAAPAAAAPAEEAPGLDQNALRNQALSALDRDDPAGCARLAAEGARKEGRYREELYELQGTCLDHAGDGKGAVAAYEEGLRRFPASATWRKKHPQQLKQFPSWSRGYKHPAPIAPPAK